MIIVLPVCAKDKHLARLNLELCVKLDGKVPFDILIAHETGFQDDEIIGLAKDAFNRVLEYSYPNYIGQPQFPFPHNYVWKMVARQIAQLNQPWFWWEPDAVPVKSGWCKTLVDAYAQGGLPFMGAWIEGRKEVKHGYMAGVGVFPAQIVRYASINTLPMQWPWDIALSRYIQMRCNRTLLIDHTIEPVSFQSIEDVHDLIFQGSVIFHKCKDGTLPKLLLGHKTDDLETLKTIVIEKPVETIQIKIPIETVEVKPPIQTSESISVPVPREPFVRFDLSDVTIFGIWYSKSCDQFIRTIRVLNYCANNFNVREVLLFCYPEPPIPTEAKIIKIRKLSFKDYNLYVNKNVLKHIHSKYAMSVHEDGFPYNMKLWDQRFLSFDYIGSPWADGVVGNGGFSISSKKLMESVASKVKPNISSDLLVCRHLRESLEKEGMRFAPKELALRFSTETIGNDVDSFGFHGRESRKYKEAWDHLKRWEDSFYIEQIKTMEPKQNPTVEIVYILVANNQSYRNQATHFMKSYRDNPPDAEHITTIVCNGGGPGDLEIPFKMELKNCSFLMHDNTGYDVGGFQKAARESKADLMVFFGATTYFKGRGWLKRIIESYQKHGDALYGTMGNHGDPGAGVNRHIRSTAFWITRNLFNQYPLTVKRHEQRYQFEHKRNCLTEWILQNGLKAFVVTWKGEYEWKDWDHIPNGFHRGDQSSLMIGDHISKPPFYPRI